MRMEILDPIDLGDGTKRYQKVFTTDECEVGSPEARYLLLELLRTLGTTPALCACGPADPQDLRVTHSGRSWEAHLEATVRVVE